MQRTSSCHRWYHAGRCLGAVFIVSIIVRIVVDVVVSHRCWGAYAVIPVVVRRDFHRWLGRTISPMQRGEVS